MLHRSNYIASLKEILTLPLEKYFGLNTPIVSLTGLHYIDFDNGYSWKTNFNFVVYLLKNKHLAGVFLESLFESINR